jgi:uncharacterized repeat protein (TIGR03803 family)
MRNLTLFLLFFTLTLVAQEPLRIWGVTPNGGANNKGTVFYVNADGSDFTTVLAFTDSTGWGPEGGLCLAPNGMLYGTTLMGGLGSPAAGTLYMVDPSNNTFTKLQDFQITDGGLNWSTPIVADDGMLYFGSYASATGNGGGAIFRLDPTDNSLTEVYGLTQATDGGAITGRLMQASDGMLYGTASQGGANNQAGTLFRYDPVGDVFTKLHDFDGAAGGRTPYGGLCEADNGWLYGTTFEGGTNNRGLLYKYHPVLNDFQVVYNFSENNGINSWSSLLRLGPDLLIGSVATGGLNSGGYHFTVVLSTDEVNVVTNFSIVPGANPIGDLLLAPDDQPYGLLSQGGNGFFGTLYRLDTTTYQPVVLHHFTNGLDGGLPRGELAFTGGPVTVRERSSLPLFTLFPNPANGLVTLRCASAELPATVRISDQTGRLLRTITLTGPITSIDLSGNAGVLHLTVISSRSSITQRVVVR